MGERIRLTSAPGERPGATVPRIEISKDAVTRALIVSVIVIHLLNIPAVAFKYLWPPHWARAYYTQMFQVSSEGKIPTWYSGCTLLAAALFLGLIAAHESLRRGRYRRHWTALGVIFFLMAMDEVVAIHEMSTEPIRYLLAITRGPLYFAWVIPAMGFLAFMAFAYFRFVFDLPPRSRWLFVIAGAVYVGGAVGMEMVGSTYAAAYGYDFMYGALATFEEVLEMSGMVLFLYGLMDHLERYAPDSAVRFGP